MTPYKVMIAPFLISSCSATSPWSKRRNYVRCPRMEEVGSRKEDPTPSSAPCPARRRANRGIVSTLNACAPVVSPWHSFGTSEVEDNNGKGGEELTHLNTSPSPVVHSCALGTGKAQVKATIMTRLCHLEKSLATPCRHGNNNQE